MDDGNNSEQENLGKRLWRRYVLVIAVIVIVAVVAVLLILHFRSSNKNTSSNKPICSGQVVNGKCQPEKSGSSATSTNGNSGSKSNNKSNNQSAVAPSSASSNTSSPNSSSSASSDSQLSNTGPGNVVVLFVGTVVLSSFLYYTRLLYKTSRSH